MEIAILGWGSLLWETHDEFDQRHDAWRSGEGPALKLEFSRISATRLGALTLVVDVQHGTLTTVAWCLSNRTTPREAVRDLCTREGTDAKNIGQVTVAPGAQPLEGREPENAIMAWAHKQRIDVVLWTALDNNFEKMIHTPFSIAAALAYVKTLDAEAKVKAAEYVWRAPAFVKTPVRSALQREPWFRE